MEIAGKPVLLKGCQKHPNLRKPISRWIDIVESANWKNLVELKQDFPAADYIPPSTYCFDLGGNNYRLLAAVSFRLGKVIINEILSHAEYDKRKLDK